MANLLRVLIVEDNDDDRQLLAAALQSGGYDLVHDCVASADEMRAALDRGVWDVVISDYSMPGFSGIEALRVVQERGLDLPFIIVSGVIGEDTPWADGRRARLSRQEQLQAPAAGSSARRQTKRQCGVTFLAEQALRDSRRAFAASSDERWAWCTAPSTGASC